MKLFAFHLINFSSLKRLFILFILFLLLIWTTKWGASLIGSAYESRLEHFINLSHIHYYTLKRAWLTSLSFWLPVFGLFFFYTATSSRIKRGYFRFLVGNNQNFHTILLMDIFWALLVSLTTSLLFSFLFIFDAERFLFQESMDFFLRSFNSLYTWSILGVFLGLVLRKNLFLWLILGYFYLETRIQVMIKYYLVYYKGINEIWADILPLNLLNFSFLEEDFLLQVIGFLLYLGIILFCYLKAINSDL